MKLIWTLSECDGENTPFSITVEGETPLQCLSAIERQLGEIYGTNLTDDLAFDTSKCIEAMNNCKPYERKCFSTPEANYTISVVYYKGRPF